MQVGEFIAQTVTVGPLTSGARHAITSNAYSDINLHYARAAGLTGAGKTIAIIDDGFSLSHNDLSKKKVTVFGGNTAEDHGTFVATIAAGNQDGNGVMGVASGADLHLTSWGDGDATKSNTAHLAAATSDASRKGAIVQNNSWGYFSEISGASITLADYNTLVSDLVNSPSEDNTFTNDTPAEAFLARYFDESAEVWTDYVSKLDEFTKQGVVVFAQSNFEDDLSSSLIAALPEIFPELKRSWVVAVNGLPEYDAAGNISEMHRLSARCLETAQYCLTANGSVRGGTTSSDSAYKLDTGTSFVAPQISGSIALLAEAFPALPAADLLKRLFASANNSFLTASGTVDFGNGVTHGYNEEFGHGFLDLKAALLPIGNVGVPDTNNAYGGVAPLSEVSVAAGTAHGDAIRNGLRGVAMAIYDSLGANFTIDARALVEEQSQDFGARLANFQSDTTVKTSTAASYSFMGNELSQDTGGFQFVSGAFSEVGEDLGFMRSGGGLFSGDSSIVSDGPGTMAFATVKKSDSHGFGALAFVEHTSDGVASAGFGFSAARTIAPDLTSVFGFSVNGEAGTALGLSAESLDDESLSAASSAFSFAGEWTYQQGLSFFANAELGMTVSSGAGYITSLDPALHSAFSAGMKVGGVFAKSDAVTFSLRQPLRVEQGSATVRLPTGRMEDGTISYAAHEIDLTPSARQLDFGLRYHIDFLENTSLGLGAALSVNEGHTQGNLGGSGILAFRHRF
ncbi:hypothetical protein GCM10007094_01810 [Pseudovibrio japonicus]|uniref:Peptidase S8/S53 domain-containing protein n=1 Tax=Pseudovibrio japonicus TaxID=366534 RepID=A0ABQ3DWJ6_9HYPH|nr:hypothetical protein GCM10007094_01810 [Pseudovibrio japonicus]